MAFEGDLSHSLNISSVDEDMGDNLLEGKDDLIDIQVIDKNVKEKEEPQALLNNKRKSVCGQRKPLCKNSAPYVDKKKYLISSQSSFKAKESKKFTTEKLRQSSFKNGHQVSEILCPKNMQEVVQPKCHKISLDIPTESYKVLQDKIDNLEKDNKELREQIKDKDILIQQQSRRIHELTESL